MPTVRSSEAARRDLVEHAVYLASEAGPETAERFLDAAEKTFHLIAVQPGIGAPLLLKSPRLSGLRKWRIDAFDRHLVFYLVSADGVMIVRVLHGSSDWWELLGMAR